MDDAADYTGKMTYLRWRSVLSEWGERSTMWRCECGFYGLLGRLYCENIFVAEHGSRSGSTVYWETR